MKYEYLCKSCLYDDVVDKPLKEIDRPERCPVCGSLMERQISSVPNVWKTGGNADG